MQYLIRISIEFQVKLSEWKIVFFIAAAFYFCGNLIFVIFGNASIQPWNEPLMEENTNSTDVENEEKHGKVILIYKKNVKKMNRLTTNTKFHMSRMNEMDIFLLRKKSAKFLSTSTQDDY